MIQGPVVARHPGIDVPGDGSWTLALDLSKYVLRNGIWLTGPALLWNIALTNRLPWQFRSETFWKDIPVVVQLGESILRLVVFALPAFFTVASPRTRRGGWVWYLGGTVIYFASWLPLLLAPGSAWSTSMLGFMAPAYTPLIWLIGIGVLGSEFYFPARYRPACYIVPAVLFTVFHCTHVALVHARSV